MRIQTWLKEIVCNPTYSSLIWWHSKERGLIAIHWKHASYEDYASVDSTLFRQWAIDNNRYDPKAKDSPEERKRWKTNFRCALHSATNIKKGQLHCYTKNGKQSYRIYELLEQPDPDKVDEKKKSNKRAAKSKLKSVSEKRAYKSRLNKCKTEAMLGPFAHEEPKDTRRVNMKKPKVEPMDVCDINTDASAITPSYQCDRKPSDMKEPPAQLPSTLEEYHEDEDHGYHSFSDSSSINSQESSYSPSSTKLINHFHGDPTNVVLEPVESIFRMQNNYDTSQTNLVCGLEYSECDIDEGTTTDIFNECGQWGTEVMLAPCISSPNVVTQFFAVQSHINTCSTTQSAISGYSLTNL